MTLPLQTCHTSSDVHFCNCIVFVLQLHLLGFAETCFPVLFVNRFCNCIVFVLQLHRLPETRTISLSCQSLFAVSSPSVE